MQGEGLLALTQHAVSLSNENPNADHGPHLDGDLALVLGQVRGQEPVTRQRAGHVERSRRAVGQRPRQSHGEGTRHRRVPWEAGEQGVDDWRSSGSEVATNHKGPPQTNSIHVRAPNVCTKHSSARAQLLLPVDTWRNGKIRYERAYSQGDTSPMCCSRVLGPPETLFSNKQYDKDGLGLNEMLNRGSSI